MVRLPKNVSNTLSFETAVIKSGASILETEVYGEKAYSLGLAAQAVEKSLAELRNFTGPEIERDKAVQRSADIVFAYFVQRELIGFANHDHPTAHYNIPKDVLSKVGAKSP